MNAIVEIIQTEERTAYKAAVADLKNQIKTIGEYQKLNKITLKERQRTGDHNLSYLDMNGKETFSYSKEDWEQYLTALHIIYNELRGRPIHASNYPGEDPARWAYSGTRKHLLEEIKEKYGVDVEKEVS